MEVQVKEIERKALDMVDRAKALVIADNDQYLAVDAFCVGLKELEKQIVEHHKDVKEKAWAAHKAAVAAETKALTPVVEARKIAKGKMAVWEDDQDRLRREEEERQRKIAQKQAEDDALEAAEAAERSGDQATADAIIQSPVQAAPVVLPSLTPKAKTVIRTVWDFRVVNPQMVPREYLTLDTVKIGGVVRSSKGTVRIPGVEAYEKRI